MTRLIIFCLSAFMAAIAGALTACLYHFAIGSEFPSFGSLTLIVIVAVIPLSDPWFAFVGAFALSVLPAYITAAHFGDWLNLLFGWGAVFAPVTIEKAPGAPQWFRRLANRVSGSPKPPPAVVPAAPQRTARDDAGLEISALSVRYGGALAVSEVSLVAGNGKITGLIGPNGAGKTTTFNAVSGLVTPSAGTVKLHGNDLSGLSPAARARVGLGRTFQRAELFNSLTVSMNIALGREGSMIGGNPYRQLIPHSDDDRQIDEWVARAAALTGLSGMLDVNASQLTTGQRRSVELARVLAGPFDMVLLDEPSSGLDHIETERFGEILLRVVEEQGIGILLVEHDMSLVRQVCHEVYVMDFGQMVFHGDTDEMAGSPVVRAAYLGEEIDATTASGDGPDVPQPETSPTGADGH
jgi:ABC-type branched-subunit amino acid transport system ATPase component